MASTTSNPLSSPPSFPPASSPPAMSEDHEQEICHFSKVPPELRLRIYGYVLKASHSIHTYWMKKPANPNFASILRVNRLINIEASPVLYQVNTIRFVARTLPVPFADSHECPHIDIPKRFVPLLRNVVVSRISNDSWTTIGPEAFVLKLTLMVKHLATDAPKLESLTLFFWGNGDGSRDQGVFRFGFRISRSLIEAVQKLPALKEFNITYGPLHEDTSEYIHVAKRREFPGYTGLMGVIGRTMSESKARVRPLTVARGWLRGRPDPYVTLKIPFSMDGRVVGPAI
ncbi:MAG: hypothetical protein M1830_007785 [Pleopsidium flavum]|nr:MAG: hypothetical protein M1830_007785 [Pleopsidium flavum]